MRYATSSQRAHWLFPSVDALTAHRQGHYDETAALIKKQRLDLSQKHPELGLAVDIEYLTLEEEQLMTCEKTFKDWDMPHEVKATAMTYMRRFYLSHLAMNHDPKSIWLACIYVACKCEEWAGPNLGASKLSIDKFIGKACAKSSDTNKARSRANVIDQEIPVIRGVKFQLTVHHPFLPLEGLLVQINSIAQKRGIAHDRNFGKQGAIRFINSSLLTDAMFLFPPSQIALAGLLDGLEKAKNDTEANLFQLLLDHMTKDSDHMTTVGLRKRGLEIIAFVEQTVQNTAVKEDEFVRIGLKLKECGNPHTNKASKAYKALQKINKSRKEDQSTKKIQGKARQDAERIRELTGIGSGGETGGAAAFVIHRPEPGLGAAEKRRKLDLSAS